MSENCPLCGSSITAEKKPFERDYDGVPWAAAIGPGFGVPWADPSSLRYRVLLDGEPVDNAVGFDRKRGLVWRFVTLNGNLVVKGEHATVEQVSGTVTVEPAEGEVP